MTLPFILTLRGEDVLQVVLFAGASEVLALLGHGDEADAHLVGARPIC
ncbi:MAG TPA: hypothetical protein VHS97_09125 [Isosphaeraceae bacterium]|jgi:hypothetical protein|nr:hypothetical protein [Isosphaeraceae bacterium]